MEQDILDVVDTSENKKEFDDSKGIMYSYGTGIYFRPNGHVMDSPLTITPIRAQPGVKPVQRKVYVIVAAVSNDEEVIKQYGTEERYRALAENRIREVISQSNMSPINQDVFITTVNEEKLHGFSAIVYLSHA